MYNSKDYGIFTNYGAAHKIIKYLFKDITWRWNRHRFREQMYGHEAGKVGGINWETVTFTYYYVQNR